MRWFACYIVLNASDFLYYSLTSIYDFIKKTGGKIIIVEGANSMAYHAGNSALMKLITESGLSRDNTTEIIKSVSHQDNVIIHRQVGFVCGEQVLRQKYFDIISELPAQNQPDYVLLLDCDELYHGYNLENADAFLQLNPYLEYMYVPSYMFVLDFNHYMEQDLASLHYDLKCKGQLQDFRYDVTGRELFLGHQIKIVRWHSGIRYGDNPASLISHDGRDIYNDPYYTRRRIAFDGCPWYHYGRLRGLQAQIERPIYHNVEMGGSGYADSSIMELDMLKKQENTYVNGFSVYPWRLRRFYGSHPGLISQHPMFNKDNFVLQSIRDRISLLEHQ